MADDAQDTDPQTDAQPDPQEAAAQEAKEVRDAVVELLGHYATQFMYMLLLKGYMIVRMSAEEREQFLAMAEAKNHTQQ
jgi:hypothetical protein